MPPWIVAPFTNWTDDEAPLTLIFPPALFRTEFARTKVPAVASSRPGFVMPEGFRVSAVPTWLAFIVPWLSSASPLFPICPAPWMVLLTFVRTPPLPDSLIMAVSPPVDDSITVPAPVKLTFPDTLKKVLFAVAFT